MSTARTDLARTLVERLDRGESGLVLATAGLGRTHLLSEVATKLRAPHAWLIHGRDRVENIPLVPFASVFADLGVDNSDPLSVYTSLPRAIATTGSLFVVDDADCLDQASAVLLTQLNRAGVAMVLSSQTVDALPPSLRERSAQPDWWAESLAPMSDVEVLALAEDLVGSPLAAPAAAALLARARGNPALVTELLSDPPLPGATPSFVSGLRVSAGVATLAGVEVGRLTDDARRLVEAVAVAGHLPVSCCDPTLLEELTRAQFVRTEGDAVVPVDALVSDLVMTQVDEHRRQVVAASAAALIADLPEHSRHHRDLLALAGLAQSPADAVAAAFWLTSEGRAAEALDLLRPIEPQAVGADWRFDRALAEAAALVELGHLADALNHLDTAVIEANTDAELVRVAEHWTLVLSGRATDDEALEQRILGILDRFSDAQVRDSVEAGLARRRAILGERRLVGDRQRGGESDTVLRALRESMGGSLKVAREIAEPSAEGLAGDDVDLDGLLRVLAQFLSMVYDGDLGHAREVAEMHYNRSAREGRPALGLWTYNRAKMAFHAGQYAEAASRAEEAIRHLAWRDVTGQAVPADAMFAASLARLGHVERAERVVVAIGSDDLILPRVAIGVARVRAERARRTGDVAQAATLLATAGQFAIEHGELFSGILALDEAAMLEPTEELAATLNGFEGSSQLADAYAARTVAIVKRDPVALADAAARLEELYQPGRAAHAWQIAAGFWRAARRPTNARRAQQQAVRVTSVWNAVAWPADSMGDSTLTARELDVARLAAQRVRSKEIAEQLALSVRTVDNHLARAYRKLGVSRRDELAEALGYDS